MSTCGCCEGVHVTTPRPVANRPSLPRLAYRVGTHGTFMASMLARLSSADHPGLARLAARTPDDAAIAILDGWATIADILTFYEERIANEGFLRTATERRSILELGRLVDWSLRPGLSATAWLSYTVDRDPQDPGRDRVVTIPRGSRVQNVPDPGQLPQTFETADDIVARASWSRLEPRRRRPPRILPDDVDSLAALYLDGAITDLKPGARLVLDFGPQGARVVRVASTAVDPIGSVTTVALLGSRGEAVKRLAARVEEVAASWAKVAPGATAAVLAQRLGVQLRDAVTARSFEALAGPIAAAYDIVLEADLAYRDRGFVRVAAWADGVLGDLEELGALIEAAGRAPYAAPGVSDDAAVAADAGGIEAGPAQGGGQRSGVPIAAVLGGLRRPASAPPADALALGRDPKALLATGSDLQAQLLGALDRRVAGTLYQAIEGMPGADAALEGVSALRIRCQPFGAAAPLRPVTDDRGIVTGSEEWPLAGEVTLTVRGGYVSDTLVSLVVSAEIAGQQFDLHAEPPAASLDLGGLGSADLAWRDGGATVAFSGGSVPSLKVDLEVTSQGQAARVSFSGEDAVDLDVPPGGRPRRTIGVRRYAASYGPVTNDIEDVRAVLAATTRQPVAPSPLDVIDLDAEYEGIVPGGWIVIERPGDQLPFLAEVLDVSTLSRTGYGLSARVTRLRLSKAWLTTDDVLLSAIRDATVFVLGDRLTLAPEPVPDDVCGATIELARVYPGLPVGRWAIVEGERTDVPGTSGVRASELVMVAGVALVRDDERPGDTFHTEVTLATPLAYCYRRATAVIHGNVARATHGETHQDEVLGSADATARLQAFPLRTKPLTWVPDPGPAGAAAALEVRVDQLRWTESRGIATLGPRDRAFVVRTDDDDVTTITFGSGERGARPPSGPANVTATYRTGTGTGGNVPAGKISQLLTRPLGVSDVVNPLPATGGADRESLEQGRRNLPLGVLALDRLVSVRDYEDFARARTGIGRASATALSDGHKRVVHLTIAGSGDAPIATSSDLWRNLRLALGDAGDHAVPVVVALRELALLVVAANVRIASDRRWSDMEPTIRAALLDQFGFEQRELGQDVLLSELQAGIAGVVGVVSVDVDTLAAVPESIPPAELGDIASTLSLPPDGRLPMRLARFEESALVIEPGTPGRALAAVAARTGASLADLVRLNPDLAGSPLPDGARVVLARGIRPAQLALLSPTLPDTLILRNVPT